jgi:anti-anti-sigma factor
MPELTLVASAAVASRAPTPAASPTLVCTWKEGSYGTARVHLAGELNLKTSLQLRYTLAEAQLKAFLLVVDLRKLTFMDCLGMQVILDAVGGAREEGGQVVLVRGPDQIDSLFETTGASQKVMIIDLAPNEPAPGLFDLPPAGAVT